MSRVAAITLEKASPQVKEIYGEIKKKMGILPNIFLNMGNSAAVLQGFLSLNDATAKTSLSPQLREQIALAVAEANQCQYCLSAHSQGAKGLGLQEQDIILARKGDSKDAKTKTILRFVKSVVTNRGATTDQDIAALKQNGVTDTEIVEIILAITINLFTNYFNHITDPKIDFPEAQKLN